MTELLAHGTVVIGGLSNALRERGHDLSSDLWTAHANDASVFWKSCTLFDR